jgi:hypothetical protein
LRGTVAYENGKPVVGVRYSLWGNATSGVKVGVQGLVDGLRRLPKDPSDPNSYSIVLSELGNGYAELEEAAAALRAAGGFDLVLPEELMRRLVANTGARPSCPLPSGPWSSQCGDLPKCWVSGNGSCILTCEQLRVGALAWLPQRGSCDLSVCRNLTLAQTSGGVRFVCGPEEGGGECPRGESLGTRILTH